MQVWNTLSAEDIIKTLEQELAKAHKELRCAQADVQKATNRVAFVLTSINTLKEKTGGMK